MSPQKPFFLENDLRSLEKWMTRLEMANEDLLNSITGLMNSDEENFDVDETRDEP
jgi:hypothetical protein